MAAGPQVGVELTETPAGALMVLAGTLDVRTAAATRREISTQLAGKTFQAVEVDASRIEHGDASGMVILYELAHGRFTPGVPAKLRGLRPELEKLLAAFPPPAQVQAAERRAPRNPSP